MLPKDSLRRWDMLKGWPHCSVNQQPLVVLAFNALFSKIAALVWLSCWDCKLGKAQEPAVIPLECCRHGWVKLHLCAFHTCNVKVCYTKNPEIKEFLWLYSLFNYNYIKSEASANTCPDFNAFEMHFYGCFLSKLMIITFLSDISVFCLLLFLKKVELFWKEKLVMKVYFQHKLSVLFHVQFSALLFQLPCAVLCLMTFVSDLFLFHNAG